MRLSEGERKETDCMQIEKMMQEQKRFFQSGSTREIEFRIQHLKHLYTAVQKGRKAIERALFLDLGKHETEAYETEIGMVLSDIRYTIRRLSVWAREKRVRTPFYLFPGKSAIRREPYGQVLIMGPYNYPFQLLMEPLIGAIAAGNCVVLKPSELAPHTMPVSYTHLVRSDEKKPALAIFTSIFSAQTSLFS